jgi:hypothetical protein
MLLDVQLNLCCTPERHKRASSSTGGCRATVVAEAAVCFGSVSSQPARRGEDHRRAHQHAASRSRRISRGRRGCECAPGSPSNDVVLYAAATASGASLRRSCHMCATVALEFCHAPSVHARCSHGCCTEPGRSQKRNIPHRSLLRSRLVVRQPESCCAINQHRSVHFDTVEVEDAVRE